MTTDNAKAPVFYRKRDLAAGNDTPPVDAGSQNPPPSDGGGTLLDPATGGEGQFEVPEKFLAKKEDGSVDWEAVTKKAIPSYRELEKRLGSGELPPKTADEYKVEKFLPEGFEANPEAMKPVLGKMHELGLNNKQVQGMLTLYGDLLGQGVATEKASMEQALTNLKAYWGDETPKNLELANKAVAVYADDEEKKLLSDPKIANNPALLRLLAKVGADLGEDRIPGGSSTGGGDSELESLRRSEAYWDDKHPDHKATVDKVAKHYEKMHQGSKK